MTTKDQTGTEIKYRQCLPGDASKAVPLIFASGPAAFNYVFTDKSNSAMDFLTFAFQKRGGEFSYDNHYAMVLNNELIGIGSVFSAHRAKSFTLVDALKIIQFYTFRSVPVLYRGLQIERIIKLPVSKEISLAHIAIDEQYRGKGYGEKLLNYLMNTTERKEEEYLILDVSEENPRAKRLYERLGFSIYKKMQSSYKNQYGHVANHYRMHLKQGPYGT